MNYEPRDYQLTAIEHLCANAGAALFLDPGMGKTSSTLAAYTVLQEAGAVRTMLVIAPLRPCYRVWPEEIRKWNDFHGLTYEILHGSKKDAAIARKADVYIVNYEGLKWLVEKHPEFQPDMVVLDESTKIKNHRAIRSVNATALALKAKRAVLLTGTPAPNSMLDLFAQIRALDGGERLGRYITHFRRQYFDEDPQRGGYSLYTLKDGADDEIRAKIKDICLTLSSTGRLKMPNLIENVITVGMPASTRDLYEQFAKEFYAQLSRGDVTAANAAVVGMKLRQIVGGGVYTEGGAEDFATDKIEALVDLVEEQQGQPVLVAVGFQHEVERIRAALADVVPGEIPYLGGGMTTKYANDVIDSWNRGELPVVLAHPTSVAHGLNLQAGGHTVVWYTLTWNLEEHIQFNARVWRQGQTSPHVVINYLVAEDTIDERVLEVLRSKDTNQKSLLKALEPPAAAVTKQRKRG